MRNKARQVVCSFFVILTVSWNCLALNSLLGSVGLGLGIPVPTPGCSCRSLGQINWGWEQVAWHLPSLLLGAMLFFSSFLAWRRGLPVLVEASGLSPSLFPFRVVSGGELVLVFRGFGTFAVYFAFCVAAGVVCSLVCDFCVALREGAWHPPSPSWMPSSRPGSVLCFTSFFE